MKSAFIVIGLAAYLIAADWLAQNNLVTPSVAILFMVSGVLFLRHSIKSTNSQIKRGR